MTTTDAHKRMQERINAMHARFDLALTGVWPYPPTEPRGQGQAMTTTEPCHDREDWQTTDEIVTWPADTHPTLSRDGGEPITNRLGQPTRRLVGPVEVEP